MSEGARERFLRHFEELQAVLPGSDQPWLVRMRESAVQSFRDQGLPTPKLEDWRFTNLKALETLDFRAVAASSVPNVPDNVLDGPRGAVGDAHLIVLVDGIVDAALSDLKSLPDGVQIRSLAASITTEPEKLENYLGKLDDPKLRALSALNQALFQDGVFIELEAHAVLERPVHILCLQRSGDPPTAVHPRNLIVAHAGSSATIVEHHLRMSPTQALVNTVTEVFVEEGAHIEHIKLQEESDSAFHLAALFVKQARDSRFRSHSLALDGGLTRFDIHAVLAEPGAECRLNGLYAPQNDEHIDHHTTVEHAAPHTNSFELYKGILDGSAKGIFHGRIHVRPDAQKINAMQTNRNLLLSDRASVNTKPQLEIYADDVRCSHGAAIGQLDEDALFYLRTRGIDAAEAKSLLTFAFANEVTAELPIDTLRRYTESFVMDWLPRSNV